MFKEKFRYAALPRVIVPYLEHENAEGDDKPFIGPDGKLPCFWMCCCNSVKYLFSMGEDKLREQCHPEAFQELLKLKVNGMQVEWMPFKSFLHAMTYMHSASQATKAQTDPHVADTALSYFSFAEERGAFTSWIAEEGGENEQRLGYVPARHLNSAAWSAAAAGLDKEFIALCRGAHRLKEAKNLLTTTRFDSLAMIVQWRKSVLFARANLLAQYYLQDPQWGNIKDLVHEMEGESVPAQKCVLQQVFTLLESSEIDFESEPAKVKRTECNRTRFQIFFAFDIRRFLGGAGEGGGL